LLPNLYFVRNVLHKLAVCRLFRSLHDWYKYRPSSAQRLSSPCMLLISAQRFCPKNKVMHKVVKFYYITSWLYNFFSFKSCCSLTNVCIALTHAHKHWDNLYWGFCILAYLFVLICNSENYFLFCAESFAKDTNQGATPSQSFRAWKNHSLVCLYVDS
jgi:hypothetical protein